MILSLIVVIFGMAGPGYIEPVLSQHLLEIGVSKNLIGVAFGMPMLGYLIATKVQSVLPEVSRGVMLVFGLLVEGIAFMTLGYSGSSSFSTAVLLIGLMLLGLGSAWAYLPSLPFMTQSVTEQYKDIDKSALSDTLSTMMGTFHYIGEAVGPASSGLLTKNFGFATGAYYFGGAIFGYCVVFTLVSGLLLRILKCNFNNTSDPRHIELQENKPKVFEEVKVSEEDPIDSFEI